MDHENENTTNIPQDQDLCLDWNDAIENDGMEFIPLEEGDYNFTVTGFERGRFLGSAKIPACNKAAITAAVDAGNGSTATVRFDIILCRSLEWRISSFFRCIGQKKHGERLVMDWNAVLGSCGRAHFKSRTYVNRYGEEKTANDVDYFLDYDPKFFTDFHPASALPSGWKEIKDDGELPF